MNCVVKDYVPQSWFHAKGVHKVVNRIKPKLPNVSGSLFLTLTFDPSKFPDAETAFEAGRDRIRRMFYRLRNGLEWEGKHICLKAPYCVKVEFHRNGWAHFHLIFLTRRFLPAEMLNKLWGFGRVNVKRIQRDEFEYLLKYTCKFGDIPEWVKSYRTIRIFQTSRGFYVNPDEAEVEKLPDTRSPMVKALYSLTCNRRKPKKTTIGERIEKWECMVLVEENGRYQTFLLDEPWQAIFDHAVYDVAMDGRYLGNGRIQITESRQISQLLGAYAKTEIINKRASSKEFVG